MRIMTKTGWIPNDFIAASRKHVSGDTSAHLHEFFEIEFVISGSGICRIDGREYPMQTGSLFLLTPVNTHELRSADAEIFNVMFRCDAGETVFSDPMLYASSSPLFLLTGDDGRLAYQLLTELVRVLGSDLSYARLLLGCLLGKLSQLGDHDGRDETLPYIRKAYRYITEHFRDGITLSETASYLGLTSTYFSDLFARETGRSFKSYLDGVRFSCAKNLLAFTELSVAEVCRASGFSDYANFSRRFRLSFGMTPMEYRREKRGKQ